MVRAWQCSWAQVSNAVLHVDGIHAGVVDMFTSPMTYTIRAFSTYRAGSLLPLSRPRQITELLQGRDDPLHMTRAKMKLFLFDTCRSHRCNYPAALTIYLPASLRRWFPTATTETALPGQPMARPARIPPGGAAVAALQKSKTGTGIFSCILARRPETALWW